MAIYASLDLGTNSVRMLVAETKPGNTLNVLKRYTKITRIGEELKDRGRLKDTAKERTLSAIFECRQILENFKVEKVLGVATSAIRDAIDGREFIELINKKTGLPFEIISGRREAKLSFCGAVGGLPEMVSKDRAVVVDIGGGSTELTYVDHQGIKAQSFQVGAVRCTEGGYSYHQITEIIRSGLNEIEANSPLQFVGVGGTITTLAAVDMKLSQYNPDLIHGTILKKSTVNEIYHQLNKMTLEERKYLKGLQPERADIIVAGTLILKTIIDMLGTEEIIVSESDLLYGLVFELSQSS